MYPVNDTHILQISSHLWMIQGEKDAKFPSGNAFVLKTAHHLVLFDTNPDLYRISTALQQTFNANMGDITDVVLSHVHLDHSHNLARIFAESGAFLYSHLDSLIRCENSTYIGLYAGIPSKDIYNFVDFGKSLLFENFSYPKKRKIAIDEGTLIIFDDIKVISHISHGHALNALDFEVFDGNCKVRLSFDYDFSNFPWYGVPFRKESLDEFLSYTANISHLQYDWILSSHRLFPIAANDFKNEFKEYHELILRRTDRAIELVKKSPYGEITLEDSQDFIYPIRKMEVRYPLSYVRCAEIWDKWLLLTHLEDAWSKQKVECIDADNDPFLLQSLTARKYQKKQNIADYATWWTQISLEEKEMNSFPWKSRWKYVH